MSDFEAHQRWVRYLRESYDSRRESMREESSMRSLDTPSDGGGASASGSGADAGDSHVVEREMAHAFDRALDFHDFDEPVYRGLGLDYGGEHQEIDFEVGHEPVYRCLGLEDGTIDFRDAPQDESMDTDWLATMPPLVHRQAARHL